MTTKHPPLLFLDVESLGLDDAPVWEVAAIRVSTITHENPIHYQSFVDHDPTEMDSELPQSFRDDYEKRYNVVESFPPTFVAEKIADMIAPGTIVCGSNPSFDMERIQRLDPIRKFKWHYHSLDIPTLVHGYLLGRGIAPAPPWKSDFLSRIVGVDPADFDRHTAMGDCRWTLAMWNAVTR